mmetsp:Transcript_53609/g.142103  ORF Transcript_53609/g.142103 Transcript_53609/m.142103 type:complete len:201 (+) Transcript_53609:484-1086(+)
MRYVPRLHIRLATGDLQLAVVQHFQLLWKSACSTFSLGQSHAIPQVPGNKLNLWDPGWLRRIDCGCSGCNLPVDMAKGAIGFFSRTSAQHCVAIIIFASSSSDIVSYGITLAQPLLSNQRDAVYHGPDGWLSSYSMAPFHSVFFVFHPIGHLQRRRQCFRPLFRRGIAYCCRHFGFCFGCPFCGDCSSRHRDSGSFAGHS